MKRIISLTLLLFLLGLTTAAAQYWEPVPGAIDRGSSLGNVFVHTSGAMFAWTEKIGWRSTDRGATWRRMSDTAGYGILRSGPDGRLYSLTNYELRVSSDDGATWERISQASVGSYLAFSGADTVWTMQSRRPYRSTDRGVTWQRVSAPGANQPQSGRMAVGGAGHVAIAINDVLFTSTDNGATWDTCSLGTSGYIRGLAYDPANNLYLSVGTRFQRSTDNGATWSGITTALFKSLSVGRAGEIYANIVSQENASVLDGIIRSTDGGVTWSTLYRDLADGPAVGPQGELAVVTGYRVRISTDGGLTWPTRNTGISAPAVYFTIAGPGGAQYALATSEVMHVPYYPPTCYALYRTTDDGASWTFLRDSLQSVLHVLPNGTIVAHQVSTEFFAGDQNRTRTTLVRSSDGGITWSMGAKVGGDIDDVAGDGDGNIIAINLEELGRRTGTTGILRSTDDGLTWTPSGHPPSFTGVAVAPNGTFFAFYTSSTGNVRILYRSTDHGATWDTVLRDTAISDICVAHDGTIYLSAATVPSKFIMRSTDNGATWTTTRVLPTYPYLFYMDGRDRIYVAYEDQSTGAKPLLRSSDGGVSWTMLRDSVRYEQVLQVDDSTLYLQKEKGLLRSTDDGATWKPFGLGLPQDDGGGNLALGADGRVYCSESFGVYRTTGIAGVGIVPASLPAAGPRISLRPNPVTSGAAELIVDVARGGDVRVVVVDRLGREVATLYDAPLDAGMHALPIGFDALRGLADGIYFCRATTPDGTATTPLVRLVGR